MSILEPISHALAALVAGAHLGLTSLGADPAAGTTWLLCVAAVVVAVRVALLPLVAQGVRVAHASARARPHLQDLASRYRNRTDSESSRRLIEERRRIAAEHGMPRLGCLPMLLQLPIWLALYQLLADAVSGVPVGAMTPELVGSLGAATLLGIGRSWLPRCRSGAPRCGCGPGRCSGRPRVRHTAVPRRHEHRDRRPAGGHGQSPADDARDLGSRSDRGGRACPRGPGGLLGVQLGMDPRAVSRHLALVPHAGLASGRPRSLGRVAAVRRDPCEPEC